MPSLHLTERQASLHRDLEEVKFWCHSIGVKILRDCVTDAPRSVVAFDVPQSDWWHEPGISHRREALRELTTCDLAQIVDTRGLRDTEGSFAKHLGTHIVNTQGMCHNAKMKGIINDVWSCIESLLREAYSIANPGARVDLALGFVCNSGRRRSVCISEMTAAVLNRMGLSVDVDHLCESDWGHLCNGGAPCPTREFRPAKKPWAEWFDWFYVQMMMRAQKRRCMEEVWWDHLDLPDTQELTQNTTATKNIVNYYAVIAIANHYE